MDDDDVPAAFGDTTTLLWVVGAAALLLVLALVIDSYRRKRRRRLNRAKVEGESDESFLGRWFRHARHRVRSIKHSYDRDRRAKASRERARS